jgi:uncharacterized protein YxjI
MQSSGFFDSNSFFIDEKVGVFKMSNNYKVYNEHGAQIGMVKQKLSFGSKILRLFLNKKMLPFHLDICNTNNGVEASISRGWTFFKSKIVVKNAQGQNVGRIQQKFQLLKPKFDVYNGLDQQIGTIKGDWKAWNFEIQDTHGNAIGGISKKWAGAMKELFTSADKYNVAIAPHITDHASKMVILSAAITIDMVLKEKD